jgi:hypothetical protein
VAASWCRTRFAHPVHHIGEMSDALNLVEILASVYLLAVIGALAYAALRAFLAKRGIAYLFPGRTRLFARADRERLSGARRSQHESTGYFPIKPGR